MFRDDIECIRCPTENGGVGGCAVDYEDIGKSQSDHRFCIHIFRRYLRCYVGWPHVHVNVCFSYLVCKFFNWQLDLLKEEEDEEKNARVHVKYQNEL